MKRQSTMMKSLKQASFGVLCGLIVLAGEAAGEAQPRARHVIVFGLDGLSPDGVRRANTPNFDRLMREGASSLHMRGVMPISSSPNWASMMMGAGPEQHGVTSNDWETNKFQISPTVVGPGGMFPTIFSVLREQRPKAVLAAFYDWDGFGRLLEGGMVDASEHCQGPTNTVERALAFIRERQPDLVFLQLDHVDHAGHQYGHGTPEYYAAVEVADKLLGELLGSLESNGLLASTIVIVTADHGGVKKGHGGATMAEIQIPWIISGPGIAKNKKLDEPLNTYDTAATVAHIFGLRTPDAWIAKPILAAFATGAGGSK